MFLRAYLFFKRERSGHIRRTKDFGRLARSACYRGGWPRFFKERIQLRSQYRGELWTATGGVYAQRTRSVAELYAAGTGDSIHNAANVAAYLQLELQPHERLHVTVGGRYEQFVLDSVSLGQPVFRAGLNYRFGQASYLRASVGQGFRFPSIAEKFIQTEVGGINVFPSLDIRPESSTNMEFGIKQGFRFGKEGQWKGFLDLAVFQQPSGNDLQGLAAKTS